ncbi:hypothetical protein QBC47DRAFT_137948 [Echria macrotheca]|uniref:Transmembrane protein n=1 Tax=Echria macrotheca TaxID=438768 RepID=A0AAJ0BI09_9PEZI|nr:hypothetical protein QBC47DRAFT_137948 [Echria macrotheca]
MAYRRFVFNFCRHQASNRLIVTFHTVTAFLVIISVRKSHFFPYRVMGGAMGGVCRIRTRGIDVYFGHRGHGWIGGWTIMFLGVVFSIYQTMDRLRYWKAQSLQLVFRCQRMT